MISPKEWLAGLRRDSAAQAQFLKTVFWLYPTALIMLGALAFFLWQSGLIGDLAFGIALVVNFPVAFLLVLAVWELLGRFSEGVAQMLYAGGNLPPGPSFSLEESMIVRGEYHQARATLEARLGHGPDDAAVQLRLAELNARWIKDPGSAERWYLAARKGAIGDRERAAIANGLIDLYRASGQTGRLMSELSRFAAAWPGTRAAEDARRELRHLKEESR